MADHIRIHPYAPKHREAVLRVTEAAWAPVFEHTRREVPDFVFDAFYRDGFMRRQRADVSALLELEQGSFFCAWIGEQLAGFIGLRVHPEDQMGEIHIIAVAPDHQRQGVAKALMRFADARFIGQGLVMVMVETIGDTRHAPARAAYEADGFKRWPVARYFKPLKASD